MARTNPNSEALAETLHEIFAEVLEDFALAETIREGRRTKRAERGEVVGVLKSKAQRPRSARGSA
jgi:hypothetical protein